MIGLMMLAAVSKFPVFFTGNDLYERCQEPSKTVCIAYVLAVSDTINDLQDGAALPAKLCIGRVVPQQEVDVVMNYLRDHPEVRGQGAGGLTVAALAAAFPCGG